MKLISIITPAFNAEKYIKSTIESVLSQTYQNWEMLIVDDCSSDNTVKIVEDYCGKDNRIKLIKHSSNKGVAVARNTALSLSKGDYIAFLDSDDMWMPCKLDVQYRFMEDNGYALTYTAYQKYISETEKKGKIINVPHKMTPNAIFYNTAIACLTVMVNRELVGDFEMPVLNHFEDQCTWQSILLRGYYAYGLNENLALYRISDSSLTANKGKAASRQWDVYRKYYGFSVIKSAVYFFGYAVNAIIKHL
ncbi:MAG: glycosyltransferase family 2 protein [Clostridia bacterium]|nr:glycosyltransferase family 2 protein [Clostridia bacterium]